MQGTIILNLKIGAAIFLLLLAGGFFLFGSYSVLEPSGLMAQTATGSVVATLSVTEEVTLTAPSDLSLLPDMTVSNSSSSATGTWNVKTNSQDGYTLTLNATSTNALRDFATGEYFTDCTTTTPGLWNSVCASSTNYIFGFSVYGTDAPGATWGAGSNCGNGGGPNTTLKYRGFASTTAIQVATRASATAATGTDISMCLTATQGAGVFAPNGTYRATIVGTATVN